MFQKRFSQVPKPEKRDNKCKIVIKKKGNSIEKTIEGSCTREQLRALSEQKDDLEE